MSDDGTQESGYRPAQRVGLIGGGVAFLLMLLVPGPEALDPAAWRTAAVAVLMAVWWMTEAIPIPATAILPLALFPLLGILTMSAAAEPYANELIFLFMGGFFLAVGMQRWGLHRRLALTIMAWTGTGPKRLVLGFMLSTAFLSMWISNTATAAMMLPIALAVGEMLRPGAGRAGGAAGSGGGEDGLGGEGLGAFPFGICLMLGVAYGSSIGGIATLIGTPPNAVMAAAASELLDVQIGFLQWMSVGVPITLFMLPVAWLLLVQVLYPPGHLEGDAAAVLADERARLGPMDRGEKLVGTVFVLTAAAWIFREPKSLGLFTIPGLSDLSPLVTDSTIAMTAAAVLFLLPVDWRSGTFALDWPHARRISWGVLVLFGGGLSLARAMERTGLAAWIGGGVATLADVPLVLVLLVVAALFIFLTEVTSNTATATMAMPVMAGAAAAMGTEPLILMAGAGLASSMAFMLPVATPPNAIVFASGYLTIPQMAKAGFWLNVIAIGVVAAAGTALVPAILVR